MNIIFEENKGITLIELLVVLAVLSIVVSATVGIFTSFIRQNSRILAEQELLNQTSYALEYISRSVRDAVQDTGGSCLGVSFNGYYYVLSHFNSAIGSYQGIKVLSKDYVCHEFFLDTDGVLKEMRDGQPGLSILSNKFSVQYIRFILNGDKSISSIPISDTVHPRVSISLDVKLKLNGEQQDKVIQTTVSQDRINVITL